jgi:hypothetical protein
LPETTSGAGKWDRLARQTLEELFRQFAPTGPSGKERLSQRVEELFRQATKRFAVPSPSDCRAVAFHLMALRSHFETFPKEPAEQKEVIKCGRRFLRLLAAEREEVAAWFSQFPQARPVAGWFRRQQELLGQIERMRQDIQSLLRALTPQYDQRDPIREIARVAKAAWKETNGGCAPRSPNPDDPLCKFVQAALNEIGRHHSSASVAEVLRRRRRKPKAGQKP